MKKILLLKAWNGHAAGSILEVDAATFSALTGDKTAKEYTQADADAEAAAATAAKEADVARVKGIVAEAVAEYAKKNPNTPHLSITVGRDTAADDPTFGYIAPGNVGRKHTADEIRYAFGLFASDVYKAGSGADSVPARLKTAMVKAREVLEKGLNFLSAEAKATFSTGDAGYMLPPEISMALLGASAEQGIVRPRAAKIDLSTNAIDLPVVEDYDRSSDLLYGGVAAYWTAESAQYTSSKPKVGNVALKLNKLTALGFVTDETMRFSPVAIGTFLFPKFSDAIAWKEDVAYLEGTGAGMPLGIFKSPNLVVIAKESGQTGGTIVAENAVKMFARCDIRKPASTAWVTNRQNVPSLFALKDAAGNAIWLATGGATAPLQQSLLGLPVVYSEKLPVAGTQNDILLADFSQYLVADDRQGPELAQSAHLRFDYGEQAFRLTKFADGRPIAKAAVTPRKGSTISPFVVVAVRS